MQTSEWLKRSLLQIISFWTGILLTSSYGRGWDYDGSKIYRKEHQN